MKRRDLLQMAAAAVPPFLYAQDTRKCRILYFTRSAGFEHSVVKRPSGQLSHSEKLLTEMGDRNGFEVHCTKDGRVFDGDLDRYDVIAFYTTGDLTKAARDGSPPMSPAGKRKLLDAIGGGKGFVGIHSATDTFHSLGPARENQADVDPYIAMIGGEFVTHGEQQEASLFLSSPKWPGIGNLAVAEGLAFTDEWYTFKNFASDLHVIMVQETGLMKGAAYQRPDFPATWARVHGKGRVYYTSLGHREDIWTNPFFVSILTGGISWACGKAQAEAGPNLDAVTPQARKLNNG